MKKKFVGMFMVAALSVSMLAGCSKAQEQGAPEAATEETTQEAAVEEATEAEPAEAAAKAALEDGVYSAKFTTDSSMFHINEAYKDRGTLTVKNGEMTLHINLPSKNIVNLFPGTAEDAQKDGAELLEPTTDTVTYEDGTTEEVNGFDVPVPYLDKAFDLALIGTKGKWYDHKVVVASPE